MVPISGCPRTHLSSLCFVCCKASLLATLQETLVLTVADSIAVHAKYARVPLRMAGPLSHETQQVASSPPSHHDTVTHHESGLVAHVQHKKNIHTGLKVSDGDVQVAHSRQEPTSLSEMTDAEFLDFMTKTNVADAAVRLGAKQDSVYRRQYDAINGTAQATGKTPEQVRADFYRKSAECGELASRRANETKARAKGETTRPVLKWRDFPEPVQHSPARKLNAPVAQMVPVPTQHSPVSTEPSPSQAPGNRGPERHHNPRESQRWAPYAVHPTRPGSASGHPAPPSRMTSTQVIHPPTTSGPIPYVPYADPGVVPIRRDVLAQLIAGQKTPLPPPIANALAPGYGHYGQADSQYPPAYGHYGAAYSQYPPTYGQYPAPYGQYPATYWQQPMGYCQVPGGYGYPAMQQAYGIVYPAPHGTAPPCSQGPTETSGYSAQVAPQQTSQVPHVHATAAPEAQGSETSADSGLSEPQGEKAT